MSGARGLSRIEEVLRFIPAQDRDTWVKIGMAVKSELGEAGFEIWDSWSKAAGNYNERDAKAVWRSLDSTGGVTVATLYYEARRYGFQASGDVHFHPVIPQGTGERERLAREKSAETERQYTEVAIKARGIWEAATDAPSTLTCPL